MHCRLLMLRFGTIILEFSWVELLCALICTVALFLFQALFATVHSKMIPDTINANLLLFFDFLSRLVCPSTPHTGCSFFRRSRLHDLLRKD
jgi:hypothetical protein